MSGRGPQKNRGIKVQNQPGTRSSSRSSSKSESRPTSPQNGNNGESDDKWVCVRCKKDFTDENSEVMECPRCDMHFCRVCVGLTQAEYQVISGRSDLHWFCPPCELKIVKNMREDKTIEKRCEDFLAGIEKRLTTVEKLAKDNKKNLDKEVKRLDNKINESTKKMKGPGTAAAKEDIAKMVKEEVRVSDEERNERERRKNNFIIFDMPEPETNLRADREEKDREKLTKLCGETLEVEIEDDDVVTAIRLGKKNDEKCRPLLVRVKSTELKKSIFTNLEKLKDDDAAKDYKFDHDQTQLQRKELKEMIVKAKNLTEEDQTGQWKYLVRGPPWNRKIKRFKIETETDSEKEIA